MFTYSCDRGHLFIQIVSLDKRRDPVVHEFDKPREVLTRVLVLLAGDLKREGKARESKKGVRRSAEQARCYARKSSASWLHEHGSRVSCLLYVTKKKSTREETSYL